MVNCLDKKLCTGCSACFNICPRNCITMQADEEGFKYPNINLTQCSRCNLCEHICPALNENKNNNNNQPQIKAAWSLNDEIRFHSTSGGIFTELAKAILKNNGYVVGARYTEEHLVEHHIINKLEDIAILRQSKYIQSEIGFVYKEIKDKLESNSKVFFVGTPCEVSGLLNFLIKDYANLITCDFVCLGSNSPKVYMKYLDMIQNKYKSKIIRVWFKNKTYGWNRFSTKIEFENGNFYLEDRYADIFMKGYIGPNKLYIRPCCSICRYKSLPRISDITLADFWGISNKSKLLDSDKGTSLVMLNSPKGQALFNNIKENIFNVDCELTDALKGNPAIFSSAKLDSRRDQFFRELEFIQFDELINKYSKECNLTNLKRRIQRRINILLGRKDWF